MTGNPYQPPVAVEGSGRDLTVKPDLTDEQLSGRRLVRIHVALVLLVSVTTIATYVLTVGPNRLPTQVIRFLLECGVCWWLYNGSSVAKWISIVLFGFGGAVAAIAIILGFSLFPFWGLIRLGKMAVIYLSFMTVLLASSSVDAFLAHQRRQKAA